MNRRLSLLPIAVLCLAVQGSRGQTIDCKLPQPSPPVEATSVGVDFKHRASPERRAIWGDWRKSCQLNPELRFPDDPLSDPHKGTEFAGPLRDGMIVTTSLNDIGDRKKGEPYKDAGLEFVVAPLTLKIKARPMSCPTSPDGCTGRDPKTGRSDHQPHAFFAGGLQAVYDPKSTSKVVQYLFTANSQFHYKDDYVVDSYFWQVDLDGHPVNRSVRVGVHGCAVSPDGQYLACEPPCQPQHYGPEGPGPDCKGVALPCNGLLVLPIDLGTTACVWRAGDIGILNLAVWSPDSKGFAYYALQQLDSNKGVLLYYRLGTKVDQIVQLLPRANQKEIWIPALFCSLQGNDPHLAPLGCQHLGTSGGVPDPGEPSVGLGSDMPAWSPDPKNLQLYVAAVDISLRVSV